VLAVLVYPPRSSHRGRAHEYGLLPVRAPPKRWPRRPWSRRPCRHRVGHCRRAVGCGQVCGYLRHVDQRWRGCADPLHHPDPFS